MFEFVQGIFRQAFNEVDECSAALEKRDMIWWCIELASLAYGEGHQLQIDLVAGRKAGTVAANVILLLEHPPVFTLGRRGGRENLRVPESFLQDSGIPLVHIERGGNITYHGPGQLVSYPIIDLHAAGMTLTDYVGRLEEVLIRTAADFGVHSGRNPINRGVWVGNQKLASLGIAVRRGITFHGFALNVNVGLEPFGWINPCGLEGIGITSLECELNQKIPMDQVRRVVKGHLQTQFSMELVAMTLPELQARLKTGVQ